MNRKNSHNRIANMSIIGRIWLEIRKSKHLFFVAIVTALFNVAVTIAIPVMIGSAIDDVTDSITNTASGNTVNYIIMIVIFVVLAAVASYILQIIAYKIAYTVSFNLRNELEQKLHRLPLSYIDRTARGELINAVSVDSEILSDRLVQAIVQFLAGILTVIGTIIIMICINIRLALVVILITPLSLLTAKLITGRSKREFAAQSALRGALSAHSVEWIGNRKIVSAFNMEDISIEKFGAVNAKLRKISFTAELFAALVNPTTRFVNGLVYTFTGFFGFMMILGVIPGGAPSVESLGTEAAGIASTAVSFGSTVTVGVLAAFLTYANQYTKPFNEISATYAELQSALASAKRIFTILDEVEEDNTESNILPIREHNLKVENVNFAYNDKKYVLKNIDFKVTSGQNIAVVGPTGCGKTTLINLLERFYEPRSGEIYADDLKFSGITKRSLRENLSMVLQDSFIFTDTVLENIRYGSSKAPDELILSAAKMVGADSFIRRLPDGYNTLISDSDELSAGQKQLICLARVMVFNMLKPSAILILDEATSNIDTVTEKKISKAVKLMTKNRTSIIIAHRLSTIKDADVIIVIDGGKIVQTGTHDELINTDGIYSQMYCS
ncbi:MAG: ABC transporter ATP-binding protein/permease [Ruminococcus sp.]|jgi:ATP-binding cassette subfamily B protein|nr:ABC transporter ATP-binding protein/permease [Ruminococcus sp.]